MTIIGAYARLDDSLAVCAREQMAALDGVELFDLEDHTKVGVVIEAGELDDAHALLMQDVRNVDGVLGVWPVFVDDTEAPLLACPVQTTGA